MNLVNWQEKLAVWQSWLLMLALFFIPIASTVSNILLLVFIFLWVFEGNYINKFKKINEHPLTYPMLAYAILYPLSLLWSENIEWGEYLVSRHLIFFMFPFFLTAVRKEHINYYLSSFLFAITLSEMFSYLVWFEFISISGINPYDPSGFSGLHNEYNNYLAFAVYLLGYSLFFHKNNNVKKFFIVLFIFTISINMFITGGRIGQIAYLLMIFLLFAQYFHSIGRLFVGLLGAFILTFSILVLAYNNSQIFKERFDLAVYEVISHDETKTGSVNHRLSFWINSLKMIPERPFFGTGIGDLPEDFNKFVGDASATKMAPSSDVLIFHHPHNQYLYELVSFGLFGFSIFVWLFYSLIKQLFYLEDQQKKVSIAFLLLFLTIMVTDSYLLNVDFCLLFVLLVAMLWQPRVTAS